RPRAQEQRAGDLAVRLAGGHESHDLELSAREPAGSQLGCGPPAEAAVDGLAEPGELGGRTLRQRPGAQLARSAVSVGEPLDRQLSFPERAEHDPCSQLRLGSVERKLETLQQVESTPELPSGLLAIAVEERNLGDGVRERGACLHARALGGPPRELLDASSG